MIQSTISIAKIKMPTTGIKIDQARVISMMPREMRGSMQISISVFDGPARRQNNDSKPTKISNAARF
jgi:hypothetical protein